MTVTLAAPPDLTVSPSSVSWTNATWETDQIVTVTATDDGTDEEPETHDLTLTTTGTTAPGHALFVPTTLSFTVTDSVTLTTSVTGPGTITPAGITNHARGSAVAVAVTPNDGAYLTSWGTTCPDLLLTTHQCGLTLTADTTVAVTFATSKPTPTGILRLQVRGGVPATIATGDRIRVEVQAVDVTGYVIDDPRVLNTRFGWYNGPGGQAKADASVDRRIATWIVPREATPWVAYYRAPVASTGPIQVVVDAASCASSSGTGAAVYNGPCALAIPVRAQDPIVYDRLDTTGAATDYAQYAFLTTTNDASSAIANFGNLPARSVELRLHAYDTHGNHRSAFYRRVAVGDTVDFRSSPTCVWRFTVTSTIAGNPHRFGISAVGLYGDGCDFKDDPTASHLVQFTWHPQPGGPAADGVRQLIIGERTGPGTYRLAPGRPWVLDIPEGLYVTKMYAFALTQCAAGAPPDACTGPITAVEAPDGSVLGFRLETGTESGRHLAPRPALGPVTNGSTPPPPDTDALFDQVIDSIREVN